MPAGPTVARDGGGLTDGAVVLRRRRRLDGGCRLTLPGADEDRVPNRDARPHQSSQPGDPGAEAAAPAPRGTGMDGGHVERACRRRGGRVQECADVRHR